MKRKMRIEIFLCASCMLLVFAFGVQGADQTADISERIASLTPSQRRVVVFNNQLELVGYDVFSDGLKLSQLDSGLVVLKKGRPFNIRYYWRFIDRLIQVPSFHVLFVNQIPIKTTHGVTHKFGSSASRWENVEHQLHGELIGHTFTDEQTYALPDQYLMWEPDLALRLNDTNYQGVLSLAFDDVGGAFGYGQQYLSLGNIDAALTEFVSFSEQADSAHVALMETMVGLLKNKILEDQKDWRVFYSLGHAARLKKQWQESADYFQKSLELNTKNGNAYYYAAVALIELARQTQALALVQKGLTVDPENIYLLGEHARLTNQKEFPKHVLENNWRGMTPQGYLFSYGAVWQKVRLYGGQYTFKFQMRGVPAVDVWPYTIIQIDGERVYEGEVRSRDAVVVEVDHKLKTGEHWVAVWFTNNVTRTNAQGQVEDADLYVDRCEIVVKH